MEWQSKMNNVIVEVLGEYFSVNVINEKYYTVSLDGNVILECHVLNPISAHWRKYIEDSILNIIHRRIRKSLSQL